MLANLCSHSDNDRVMSGEWCTPELQKAPKKGYPILKIHEVWHFPDHQRKTGLFAPYVNTLLKYKREASGWPTDCDTQEMKDQYVKDFVEREEIKWENMNILINRIYQDLWVTNWISPILVDCWVLTREIFV